MSIAIVKTFKGFRNVRQSIETSGDISVLWSIAFLWGSEVLKPMEWTQDYSARNLGLLILKELWWVKILRCHHFFYALSDIPKSLEFFIEILVF